jgi:SWI/SNF-related matrix-associated actin-dependent regulator 1 of chromatin subfamily A
MAPMYYTLTPNCYKVSFQYQPMLVKCIKRIPSARYQADGRFWEVSVQDIAYLQKMGQWAKDMRLVTNVLWVEDSEPVQSYEPLPMPHLEVPHNMLMEPYEYQKEGIAYALEKKRCIMGDEPGLGKTAQAIGVLTVTKAFPALVICPASLKVNWQRELQKFGGLTGVILNDDNKQTWQRFWEMKKSDGRACAEVFIVNYESLKKFFVENIRRDVRFTLKSVDFDERVKLFRTVIIDESHKCKNSSTQQSEFVQGIAMGKEYVLELTGTPVVNNNIDLIQQLNIMGRLNDFGGYSKFMARYCAGERKSSHLKELNWLLRKNCFFRRMKKDVLTQLPDKTRSYLVTDIDNMKEYKAAERDVIKYLRDYRDADDEKIQKTIRGAIMVKMSILKQISAKGKVSGAIDIIHNTIDGGQKLIVFCFLKEVVQALKQEFRDAVTVTGDDNDRQKQWAVDRFQSDESCRLIILNYRSGGTGLTLTAASNVLFVEQPWTYSECCQAEDRAHRNGQKNAVNCVYLLGDGTIDEYMYNLIQSKKDIANGVTGTEDDVEEKMSHTDFVVNAAMDIFGKQL